MNRFDYFKKAIYQIDNLPKSLNDDLIFNHYDKMMSTLSIYDYDNIRFIDFALKTFDTYIDFILPKNYKKTTWSECILNIFFDSLYPCCHNRFYTYVDVFSEIRGNWKNMWLNMFKSFNQYEENREDYIFEIVNGNNEDNKYLFSKIFNDLAVAFTYNRKTKDFFMFRKFYREYSTLKHINKMVYMNRVQHWTKIHNFNYPFIDAIFDSIKINKELELKYFEYFISNENKRNKKNKPNNIDVYDRVDSFVRKINK